MKGFLGLTQKTMEDMIHHHLFQSLLSSSYPINLTSIINIMRILEVGVLA